MHTINKKLESFISNSVDLRDISTISPKLSIDCSIEYYFRTGAVYYDTCLFATFIDSTDPDESCFIWWATDKDITDLSYTSAWAQAYSELFEKLCKD